MEAFDSLVDVAKQLNGPGGCPWDHTQTFESLKRYVLEEAHEVIEAVDSEDDAHLVEELGDLLYTVIFYAMIAQKSNRFSLSEIIDGVKEKLVRRHPHVFGDEEGLCSDEVIKRWEEIKKEEKPERKSALDGIPKTLSLLAKAEKTISKMEKAGYPVELSGDNVGAQILKIVLKEKEVESSLRKELFLLEKGFREWEKID